MPPLLERLAPTKVSRADWNAAAFQLDAYTVAPGTKNITFGGTGAFASTLTASNLSGTNTGDQTSIVGITGTKAQFDTAVTDGNILYVGDITQYTDEMAQDALGVMVDASLTYVDATPLLQRAALTGDVTATAGSNATAIANNAVTYAKMQNVSATDRLLGRSTAGAGDVEEIACTAAGRALIDDADAPAQRTTLGLGTAATQNTGTSGANVPLLSTANIWSIGQTITDGALTVTRTDTGGHSFTGAGVAIYVNSSNSNGNTIGLQLAGVTAGYFGIEATEGFRVADSAATLRFSCTLGATPTVKLNSTQVLTTRRTGWGAPTGTATRTTFDTATVTTAQLAERVKALLDDLNGTAGHGLIGT